MEKASPVIEIPNALPFRGRTYIETSRADKMAAAPTFFKARGGESCSFSSFLEQNNPGPWNDEELQEFFRGVPPRILVALAQVSTEPRDLAALARLSCALEYDDAGDPTGIFHEEVAGKGIVPQLFDHDLFETVANNPALPDAYKTAMVLKPGIQGTSEIIGEFGAPGDTTHVYEYLRRNSYIPWGHYASNMADDAVRYSLGELTLDDFCGMRHLFYQRTFLRFAEELGINCSIQNRCLTIDELDVLQKQIVVALEQGRVPFSDATLWGWNYGYDFSPSGFRLNGSHQQIHQQYALIPATVPAVGDRNGSAIASFCCGDLVREWLAAYRAEYGVGFFQAMEKALRNNCRMDGRDDLPRELIVLETDGVLLFVPKAQTSHWELQVMPTSAVGMVLEADRSLRQGLDRAIWTGMRLLHGCGARLVTVIEYGKRISAGDNGQRIVYDLLPKMEHAPMTFSQTQHRWIVGHYPEDFAAACRERLADLVGCS